MSNASSLERVAITGGTGFIGSHLVRALAAKDCTPVLLCRANRQSSALPLPDRSVDWIPIDLADDESLSAGLNRARPEVLFHLAGTRGRETPNRPMSALAETNVRDTVRVLEAAQLAGVRRILIMGSAEEYGAQAAPLREDLPLLPASPYGISKAAATLFARSMHKTTACPVVVIRPFSVYGPGQPSYMFVADAISCAVRGTPFRMSHGNQKRDLIYVTDVIEALLKAALAPGIEGRAINVGTGQAHRLRDVAALIWQLTGSQAPLDIGALPVALDDQSETRADTSLAREALGWEAKVSLEEGLPATIEYEKWAVGGGR